MHAQTHADNTHTRAHAYIHTYTRARAQMYTLAWFMKTEMNCVSTKYSFITLVIFFSSPGQVSHQYSPNITYSTLLNLVFLKLFDPTKSVPLGGISKPSWVSSPFWRVVQGRNQDFMGRGGGGYYVRTHITCAKAEVPHGRIPGPTFFLEALGVFDALSCYLSLIFKQSNIQNGI